MITLSSTEKKSPIPPLLRIGEVAKLLSVSRQTIHNLIDSGALTASYLKTTGKRKHRRITRHSLLSFYKNRFGRPLSRDLENPFNP